MPGISDRVNDMAFCQLLMTVAPDCDLATAGMCQETKARFSGIFPAPVHGSQQVTKGDGR